MSSAKEDAVKKAPGFSRSKIKRIFPIWIKFDTGPLAENAPIMFPLRIQLSKDAMARREKWLGQTAPERNASLQEQILDEVADLLADEPEGIEDWAVPAAGSSDGPGNVGNRLRQYVAETDDHDALFLVQQIIEAASNGYWAAVTPHEFRPKVSGSSA